MSLFQSLFGSSLTVFFGLTVVFMGGCAIMTGQALANNWRPARQAVFYALLLGLADRFLTYALFQGVLLSVTGYALDSAFLAMIALLSWRAGRAHQMATQYPWLYQRAGLFSWRER